MSFLTKLLAGMVEKLARSFLSWVFDLFVRREKYGRTIDENKRQAEIIQTIADEIKDLIRKGEKVPDELFKRLEDEQKKLIGGTFDGGDAKPIDDRL